MDIATPNLAQDLVRIHKVITRGINVGIQSGSEYLRSGLPQENIITGYINYVHCLASVLGAHHLAEDQVVFPALRSKFPKTPFDRLSADHQVIEKLLGVTNQAVTHLSTDHTSDSLKILVDTIGMILSVWEAHIGIEELNFSSNAINALLGLDEQAQLSVAVGKHSQEHVEPLYLVVPFTLYNLGSEDRAAMAAALPPQVVEQLVPIVWKDQWSPMKPFLLE
jgi:hypothetical protein